MNLLATGLSGFVGTWLRRNLASPDTNSCWHVPDIEIVDILDRQRLDEIIAETAPDAVIHLAARSDVPASLADPIGTVDVNVIGTLNLLDALEHAGFQGRLLFVGSGDEYGLVAPEELPISEAAPLRPRNPYAASKVAAEMFVLERARRGRIDAVCVRAFNHTGPDQDVRFVLPSLARQIARIAAGRQAPEIEAGDLDVTRDFLDVRDVVDAYLHLLSAGEGGGVYNVCSGVERHLGETLQTLLSLAGVHADVKRQAGLLRPAEQKRSRGDGSRLQASGWQQKIAWNDTLAALLDFWRKEIEKETK